MFFLFLCVWSYLVLQCYLLLRCWMHTFFICFKHVYGFVPSLMLPYVEIEGRLCLYLAGIWLDLHRDFHDALWYGSKEINDKERCRLVINLDRSLCLCWWWYPDFSASCLQDIRTNVSFMLPHSPLTYLNSGVIIIVIEKLFGSPHGKSLLHHKELISLLLFNITHAGCFDFLSYCIVKQLNYFNPAGKVYFGILPIRCIAFPHTLY